MRMQGVRERIRADKRFRRGYEQRLRRPIPPFGLGTTCTLKLARCHTSRVPRSVHFPQRQTARLRETGFPQRVRRRTRHMRRHGTAWAVAHLRPSRKIRSSRRMGGGGGSHQAD